MTKDEGRRNDEIQIPTQPGETLRYSFIRASFDIRHSSFVIGEALASLHFPVFDEFVRNFFEESRWPLENVAVATG